MRQIISLGVLFSLCLGVASSLIAAAQPRVGGPCEYETIKGFAKVTAVKVIDNGGQPSTLVDFDWTLDAKDAHSEPMRLSIDSLKCKDKKAAEKALTVGSRHELVLEKIVRGTCTPRIWTYVGPAK
ncbi:hypothetical protein [Humisphaera borealis]|uniref:Uncharacterized protein n=1 Tax=Humisphaera borealis TaxID=2807512 RepID=A0A7M2WXJ4_9BACT|nr:hypothetical protein [Humisphaera borealis]QOV89922.1 hypothetical protein IPV69_00690 [Humisphaera borealis]